MCRSTAPGRLYFNSRPCTRGDVLYLRYIKIDFVFQFTPLHEGRQAKANNAEQSDYFNSRPCTRGDRAHPCRGEPMCYFNSRPCTRGDRWSWCHNPKTPRISIHAPARGATEGHPDRRQHHAISIHAPARGATPQPLRAAFWRNFNSRPCTRGDSARRYRCFPCAYFNSRPCTRGDAVEKNPPYAVKFQFTPLHEGRLALMALICPRVMISIHAPARGATIVEGVNRSQVFISIHAPARGATSFISSSARPCIFQFTPLHEGRRQKICVQRKSFVQSSQINAL